MPTARASKRLASARFLADCMEAWAIFCSTSSLVVAWRLAASRAAWFLIVAIVSS